MPGVPSWLYYLMAVAMLAVAAYCLTLLLTSVPGRRTAGRDVEIAHVAMGLAMAGMFVPAWSFGPSWAWELVFLALLGWFVVQAMHSVQRYGLHVPHTAIHGVMSFAMLLMYWFPMAASNGAMSMSGGSTSTGGARMDPGLALFVAIVLFGSAIFTIASPDKGATHFGTHGPGAVPAMASDGHHGAEDMSSDLDEMVGRPALVDATHVVMCVGMGLMLILMI